MVYLRIDEILKEKKKTKYWLIKKLGSNYKSASNMIEKETVSITFDMIDRLCDILECSPGDLFNKSNN